MNLVFNQQLFDSLSRDEQLLYLRFGHRTELTAEDLAELTGLKNIRVVSQKIYDGTFEIPTYTKGRSRFASLKHAACYLGALESGALDKLKVTQASIHGPQRARDIGQIYGAASL
jgi:hypothetical protein